MPENTNHQNTKPMKLKLSYLVIKSLQSELYDGSWTTETLMLLYYHWRYHTKNKGLSEMIYGMLQEAGISDQDETETAFMEYIKLEVKHVLSLGT